MNNINKEKAMHLWKKRYGNSENEEDFAGRPIYIDDYNNEKLSMGEDGVQRCYGWNIHHIVPKSKNGSDNEGNLEIVNIITNREAEDKNSFTANGKKYEVRRIKYKPYRGIFEFKSGKKVVDNNDY